MSNIVFFLVTVVFRVRFAIYTKSEKAELKKLICAMMTIPLISVAIYGHMPSENKLSEEYRFISSKSDAEDTDKYRTIMGLTTIQALKKDIIMLVVNYRSFHVLFARTFDSRKDKREVMAKYLDGLINTPDDILVDLKPVPKHAGVMKCIHGMVSRYLTMKINGIKYSVKQIFDPTHCIPGLSVHRLFQ